MKLINRSNLRANQWREIYEAPVHDERALASAHNPLPQAPICCSWCFALCLVPWKWAHSRAEAPVHLRTRYIGDELANVSEKRTLYEIESSSQLGLADGTRVVQCSHNVHTHTIWFETREAWCASRVWHDNNILKGRCIRKYAVKWGDPKRSVCWRYYAGFVFELNFFIRWRKMPKQTRSHQHKQLDSMSVQCWSVWMHFSSFKQYIIIRFVCVWVRVLVIV